MKWSSRYRRDKEGKDIKLNDTGHRLLHRLYCKVIVHTNHVLVAFAETNTFKRTRYNPCDHTLYNGGKGQFQMKCTIELHQAPSIVVCSSWGHLFYSEQHVCHVLMKQKHEAPLSLFAALNKQKLWWWSIRVCCRNLVLFEDTIVTYGSSKTCFVSP